jgi:hypothetical protein
MGSAEGPTRCDHCPGRTPFRPDPESVQRARQSYFEPPLDEGIREIVITLVANGVETFESCEGGRGHSFPEPTVRFEGGSSEGLRAIAVALENGLPVRRLRRVWGFEDNSKRCRAEERGTLTAFTYRSRCSAYSRPCRGVVRSVVYRVLHDTDRCRDKPACRRVSSPR